MKTISCATGIWCNCGVAVAAGRDVFVVSRCNTNGPWDIGFKRCDDNVLKNKILTRGSLYIVSYDTLHPPIHL